MSILNVQHNVLFIHVPRTAGTSMEKQKFLGGGGHETIRDYQNINNVFKFAFVRNPWDRFVSGYFCHDSIGNFGVDRNGFNEYIKFCATDYPGSFPMHSVYAMHFLPMYHFLLNKQIKLGVDFVGRFESLQKDWAYVCNVLGVSADLAHYRKVDREHYKYYYLPETWNYIEQLYWQDITLFGYQDDSLGKIQHEPLSISYA